ncbi:14611_t:CDS:2 [Ambispora leptoticha]|uniref:14611_t:CDS:1 n=1 Tax=Ambispora leptoticha TaxID=144679 RepID=A0A9N9D9L0_9GLOM|nr:14611_t:CDS:2 [Ambispora leptoticha]
MSQVIQRKVEQYPALEKELLDTGYQILIEDTQRATSSFNKEKRWTDIIEGPRYDRYTAPNISFGFQKLKGEVRAIFSLKGGQWTKVNFNTEKVRDLLKKCHFELAEGEKVDKPLLQKLLQREILKKYFVVSSTDKEVINFKPDSWEARLLTLKAEIMAEWEKIKNEEIKVMVDGSPRKVEIYDYDEPDLPFCEATLSGKLEAAEEDGSVAPESGSAAPEGSKDTGIPEEADEEISEEVELTPEEIE